jgi:hypothetical protein
MQTGVVWSDCGQVCFFDGIAWALTKDLRPVALGIEDKVKETLSQSEFHVSANTRQLEAWKYIADFRKGLFRVR